MISSAADRCIPVFTGDVTLHTVLLDHIPLGWRSFAHSPELRPTMVHLPERLTTAPGAQQLAPSVPDSCHFTRHAQVSPARYHSLYGTILILYQNDN